MIRIAILEKEQCAKDIIYELGKIITETEWSFACYTKISQLVKADETRCFDLIILHEMFCVSRVKASLITHHPRRLLIYCMETDQKDDADQTFDQILYINRRHMKQELTRITPYLHAFLRMHREYTLSYRNVMLTLQMADIYYIEKQDKNIIFHSARGAFKERKTLREAETYFRESGFIRIHARYVVNVLHVSAFTKDEVMLACDVRLPIARARKKAVVSALRERQL